MTKLRVLDLFSGIGGFSLGLERTGGFETVAFCEIDPFCRQVLAKHWPGVQCFEDVTKSEFEPGSADIIVGGFPCQDVSHAGKRAGLAGERSGLYRELVRAVRLVRPKHVIVENVAALLGDGLDIVVGDLASIGYCVEWDCLPAAVVGAPHERDRVYIVAHFAHAYGSRESQSSLSGEEIRMGNRVENQGAGRGLADAAGDGRRQGGRGDLLTVLRGYETRHAGTLPTPTARDWRSGKASEETHGKNAKPLNETLAKMSNNRSGQTNPRFLEWMMMYPIGWTE